MPSDAFEDFKRALKSLFRKNKPAKAVYTPMQQQPRPVSSPQRRPQRHQQQQQQQQQRQPQQWSGQRPLSARSSLEGKIFTGFADSDSSAQGVSPSTSSDPRRLPQGPYAPSMRYHPAFIQQHLQQQRFQPQQDFPASELESPDLALTPRNGHALQPSSSAVSQVSQELPASSLHSRTDSDVDVNEEIADAHTRNLGELPDHEDDRLNSRDVPGDDAVKSSTSSSTSILCDTEQAEQAEQEEQEEAEPAHAQSDTVMEEESQQQEQEHEQEVETEHETEQEHEPVVERMQEQEHEHEEAQEHEADRVEDSEQDHEEHTAEQPRRPSTTATLEIIAKPTPVETVSDPIAGQSSDALRHANEAARRAPPMYHDEKIPVLAEPPSVAQVTPAPGMVATSGPLEDFW